MLFAGRDPQQDADGAEFTGELFEIPFALRVDRVGIPEIPLSHVVIEEVVDRFDLQVVGAGPRIGKGHDHAVAAKLVLEGRPRPWVVAHPAAEKVKFDRVLTAELLDERDVPVGVWVLVARIGHDDDEIALDPPVAELRIADDPVKDSGAVLAAAER